MHRLFVTGVPDGGKIVLRDTGQLHHLRDVLRLGVGDVVVLCHAAGGESECVIRRLDRHQAELAITTTRETPTGRVSLTVACAIPKRNRMDDVVDKLSQMGVDRIVPMQTARSIVNLGEETEPVKLGRWQRLARAAAQQSRRSSVPVISEVADLGQLLQQSVEFELKLILTLSGDRRTLAAAIAGSRAQTIIALVGPEGDFTPEEVALATRAGFVPVSLGGNVLRVETAAIALAAYISISRLQ